MTILQELYTRFDQITGITGAHLTMDDTRDVNSVVSVIMKKILETRKGRLLNIQKISLPSLNQKKVLNYKQRQMIKYKHAIGEGDHSDTDASDIESDDGESEELSIEITKLCVHVAC